MNPYNAQEIIDALDLLHRQQANIHRTIQAHSETLHTAKKIYQLGVPDWDKIMKQLFSQTRSAVQELEDLSKNISACEKKLEELLDKLVYTPPQPPEF